MPTIEALHIGGNVEGANVKFWGTAMSTTNRNLSLLVHRRLAMVEIEELRRYGETLEQLLAGEKSRFESRLEVFSKSLPELERTEYLEHYSDEYRELTTTFPNQLRCSLLISGYSTLEARVVSIAKAVLKQTRTRLAFSDLGGNSPLAKSRVCMEKVAGLKLNNASWELVEPYRVVRNVVVHNAAKFDEKPPAVVVKLAGESVGLSISTTGHVELEKLFATTLFAAMEGFYSALFASWGTWMQALEGS